MPTCWVVAERHTGAGEQDDRCNRNLNLPEPRQLVMSPICQAKIQFHADPSRVVVRIVAAVRRAAGLDALAFRTRSSPKFDVLSVAIESSIMVTSSASEVGHSQICKFGGIERHSSDSSRRLCRVQRALRSHLAIDRHLLAREGLLSCAPRVRSGNATFLAKAFQPMSLT